jgi:hypothetical protein
MRFQMVRSRRNWFVRQSNAMASVRKPVIVRKFSRDWCAGYASLNFGQNAPELEILDPGGKVIRIAWALVKWVCYVRDFPAADSANPERLLHKRFALRPRTAGVWLRMLLNDGEELEGLAANDWKEPGFSSLRPTCDRTLSGFMSHEPQSNRLKS